MAILHLGPYAHRQVAGIVALGFLDGFSDFTRGAEQTVILLFRVSEIIAAGYRIGPFEVESACLEHPAVAEAAVVASPDQRRGHVVKAFIVLAEGHEGSDDLVKEIQSHVRERLSAYAYPRLIEFTETLPKTLTGKIRRIELREAEERSAALRRAG